MPDQYKRHGSITYKSYDEATGTHYDAMGKPIRQDYRVEQDTLDGSNLKKGVEGLMTGRRKERSSGIRDIFGRIPVRSLTQLELQELKNYHGLTKSELASEWMAQPEAAPGLRDPYQTPPVFPQPEFKTTEEARYFAIAKRHMPKEWLESGLFTVEEKISWGKLLEKEHPR